MSVGKQKKPECSVCHKKILHQSMAKVHLDQELLQRQDACFIQNGLQPCFVDPQFVDMSSSIARTLSALSIS